MNTVCEVCGAIGYKHLLLCCSDCKGAATHQYCLDKVMYDASLADWYCNECHQRHSEGSYSRSLGKVPSERPDSHAHFGCTSQQRITKRVESARVVGPGQRKSKSYMAKSAYLNRKDSLQNKCIRKKSNMRGKGINRRGGNAASIACTSRKALHSCEIIGTESAKDNNDGNRHVDNENSVQTLKNDCGSNYLPPGFKQINPLKPLDGISSEPPSNVTEKLNLPKGLVGSVSSLEEAKHPTPSPGLHSLKPLEGLARKSKKAPQSLTAPFRGLVMKTKKVVSGSEKLESSNPRIEQGIQNDALDKAMSDSSNMGVLPKENSCLPSMCIENGNLKENQSRPSKLLVQAYSSSSLVLEASATEVEIADAVQNFGKDNPRKRRRLILPYDDDDDEDKEEKAEDVQRENINPQPPKSDEPMAKHTIDTEYYVGEAVQTGDLNDQNLMNGRPVKRRRRYIVENEDEEDIVGAVNAECALNGATNLSLNDGAKMASQTVVATDHPLQSSTSNSDSAYQQYYIYSQPLDEPVWSGVFKIDTEVFVKLDAHLSTKACQRVWELSRSLQPVVEVMKLPRSQAWPNRWTSSGPTDDSIALFFFPHSLMQNKASNRLVNQIIEDDGALKVTVGIAELLIFPSILLPEQYHFSQGKHYLWGVFKRRKDMLDGSVQVEEQVGSAHATKGRQEQERDLSKQEDEEVYESSDKEAFVVKHVVHFENQLLVECNPEAQKEATKVATIEGTTSPGSSWPSAKPNSPKAGSYCSVQPRIERKLHALGDVDQQEYFTSLPEWNASSITEQSSDSGPAERGHGQPLSGSEPSTMKLFGLVAARTPRSQQLIQEMASEGALLFPVPEEIVTTKSSTGMSTGVVSELSPETECPHHLHERTQAFDFVSMGHGEPDAASEACLELFPVRQEQIGWAPRVEICGEVDLDLSLVTRPRAPSVPSLF